MTRNLWRYTISIVMGASLAVLFISLASLFDYQVVHAQALEDLGENIGGSTVISDQELPDLIGGLLQVILGFLGIIFVVMILLGGFKWMTASSSDKKLGEAKATLSSGVIGLIIIVVAYAVTSSLLSTLTEAIQ